MDAIGYKQTDGNMSIDADGSKLEGSLSPSHSGDFQSETGDDLSGAEDESMLEEGDDDGELGEDDDEQEGDEEGQDSVDGGVFNNVAQGLSGHFRTIMIEYWQRTINSIESDEEGFKVHQLPLARIKKVMKADEDVKMISAEAPILFAKGCDIFITELTMRAWLHAEENKRRTLQRSDIARALQKSDMFDFLIDVVPREDAYDNSRPGQGQTRGGSAVGSAGGDGYAQQLLGEDEKEEGELKMGDEQQDQEAAAAMFDLQFNSGGGGSGMMRQGQDAKYNGVYNQF